MLVLRPWQAEETAGALDRVYQAEDVIQNLCVVGVLLEPHQLIVDRVQALIGLRQEFPQKIIHLSMPFKYRCNGRPLGITFRASRPR